MKLKVFITFLVTFFMSVLTFLIGNEAGSFVASACTAGVFGGVSTALAYHFGMMCEEDGNWDGKSALWMVVAAVVGGMLGGLVMLG